MVALALEVHQEHGTKAAVAWVLRQALLDDRQIIFSLLADALREKDQEATLQFLWRPTEQATPENAERLARKMFQAGNLSGTGALLRGAEGFDRAVRYRDALDHRALRDGACHTGAIVFSPTGTARGVCRLGIASFPGVRLYDEDTWIVAGLVKAGVDCIAFTRPGFPGTVRKVIRSSGPSSRVQKIGEVTYIHTKLPDAVSAANDNGAGERCLDDISQLRVGDRACRLNSRNALPH